MAQSVELLDRLIAFPTVSSESNLDLIDFVRAFLAERGIDSTLYRDARAPKANLFATIGPPDGAGVLLSGHTDVVPVEGQAWSSDPFRMVERDGRLYGRGTADMKGFIACALRAAALAAGRPLNRPLHLAFSYDEEIGCLGVRSMLGALAAGPLRPAFCIVGEPTSMLVATGHKGKTALRATCCGREAHSALAPRALNAIHLAVDFIDRLRARQADIERHGTRDAAYDVPYTTLHVGRIEGGVALNIVPNRCTVDFEFRNLAGDDPQRLLQDIEADAQTVAGAARQHFPEAAIGIETVFAYPGLETPVASDPVAEVARLAHSGRTLKVAFGTEGGLIHDVLGVPAVVCGPGSMEQGHKPDEFVSREQLARCDAMMDALLDRLCA